MMALQFSKTSASRPTGSASGAINGSQKVAEPALVSDVCVCTLRRESDGWRVRSWTSGATQFLQTIPETMEVTAWVEAVARLIDGQDFARIHTAITQALSGGEGHCSLFIRGDNSRRRKIDLRVVGLPGNSADCLEGLVIVLVDLTRLEEMTAEAHHMWRMGILAAGTAHDFNNILQAIIGYTDLALQRFGNLTPLKRYLESIQSVALHGRQLASNLLGANRKHQEPAPEPLPFDTALSQTVALIRLMLEENGHNRVEIETEIASTVWNPALNPLQLQQILVNLCLNARDALPNGGRICISAHNRTRSVLTDSHRSEARFVEISVADSGVGMTSEVQDHIFDPLYTTKETGKGVGLGLAFVREVVSAAGGWINVTSAPGCGTRFEVWLPTEAADLLKK